MKKIAITLRISKNSLEVRDSLSHDWLHFFNELNYVPILIPNLITDLSKFLDTVEIDGIILSGGDNFGDDELRDTTEKKLIEYGIRNNLPILGVCRGMQVLNRYFDGQIRINQAVNHTGTHHIVNFQFHKIPLPPKINVKSFHNNLIKMEDLGKELQVIAICDNDQSVEGFMHKSKHIMGVMWHPEREKNDFQRNLLKEFMKNDF